MKIIGIIPAHLNSKRFPKKILYKIGNLPMIEHVRRRALISKKFNKVIVCTCDKKIKQTVLKYGGSVIFTSRNHKNGTSRVIEAINKIDGSHFVILQGDEPLLDPKYLESLIKTIRKDDNKKNINSWNLISKIEKFSQIKNPSFVKCFLDNNGFIKNLFRNIKTSRNQKVYKILGLIAFKRNTLLKLKKTRPSLNEKNKSIEQLRIIENSMNLKGVVVKKPLPSVNEFQDLAEVNKWLKSNKYQKKVFNKIQEKFYNFN